MRIDNLHIRRGQALNEYALILVGLAVAAIVILSLTGAKVHDSFCTVAGAMGDDTCEAACTLSFDDPSALDNWKGWDTVNGKMTVEGGKLCNAGNQMNHFSACAENGFEGPGYSDFTAKLEGIEIQNYDTGSNPGFDFTFRSDGAGNAYWFSYSAQNNRVIFWKQVNGARIQMASKAVPASWVDEVMDFELTVEGDTFSVSRDGEVLLEVSDDTYDSGIFGWRNKPGSTTCIDDITIN